MGIHAQPLIFCFFAACALNSALLAQTTTEIEAFIPADPQEFGKVSFSGVDTDHDGVRDDVENFIYNRYPNMPDVRKAHYHYAATLMQFILKSEGEPILISDLEYIGAYSCAIDLMVASGYSLNDSMSEMVLTKTKVLNTNERLLDFSEKDSRSNVKPNQLQHLEDCKSLVENY